MNLDQFLDKHLSKLPGQLFPVRAYIEEPGFNSLYVRLSARFIDDALFFPVFDVASLEVRNKGQGVFTRRIQQVRAKYPNLPIYVESVVNERFARYLLKQGFELVRNPPSPSFLWRTHDQTRRSERLRDERHDVRANAGRDK
jgi:hypothetical protein